MRLRLVGEHHGFQPPRRQAVLIMPRSPCQGRPSLELGLVLAVSASLIAASTHWTAQPRHDGAGYAVLAKALTQGQGFRAIDHPNQPLHSHFPPGYPLLLAIVFLTIGMGPAPLHLVSAACTSLACCLTWFWFRRLYAFTSALLLTLAVAVNWQWNRTGAAILSEPLFLLLSQAAILTHHGAAKASRPQAWLLSALLAACLLTRWIAAALVAAVLLDLILRGRNRRAALVALLTFTLVAPWLVYTLALASRGDSLPALFLSGNGAGMARGILARAWFYTERIPDALAGPFVEVGVAREGWVRTGAQVLAVLVSGLIALGLRHGGRRPAGRLPALYVTLTILLLLLWPYTEAGRFLIPLIPSLVWGAAEGMVIVLRTMQHVQGLARGQARTRLAAAGVVLASALPFSIYQACTGRARTPSPDSILFDHAAHWLAVQATRPGPVLSRHPGDLYWRTGRQGLEVESAERPGHQDATAASIAELIKTYHAAYLFLDEQPYQSAHRNPLERYVQEHERSLRLVWVAAQGPVRIRIYELPGT